MSTLLVLYFICPPLSPEGPPLPGFPLPQARASLSGEKRSPRTGLGPGQEVQTSAEEGMIFQKPQAGLSPVAFRPVLSPPGAGGLEPSPLPEFPRRGNGAPCRPLPGCTVPPAGGRLQPRVCGVSARAPGTPAPCTAVTAASSDATVVPSSAHRDWASRASSFHPRNSFRSLYFMASN